MSFMYKLHLFLLSFLYYKLFKPGFYGYDSVVLGRNIADIPDIKRFIDGVHEFRGAPRTVGFGMKGMNY